MAGAIRVPICLSDRHAGHDAQSLRPQQHGGPGLALLPIFSRLCAKTAGFPGQAPSGEGHPSTAPPPTAHMHIRTKYSRVLTITGQPISHLGRTYLYLLSTTIWYGLQNSGLALKGVPSSNQCCPIYMQFKFEIQWEFQGDLILRHPYNTYRWSPPSLVPKLSPVFSHRCVVRWVSHFAIFVRTRECMNDDGKLGEAS